MTLIFTLTLPFFALVGLGYASNVLGWLPKDGVRSINVFVFNFAVPALVVGALGRQDFSALINVEYLSAWLIASLTIFVLGALISRLAFSGNRREMALFGQASSVGNLGFLALPLLIVVVGDHVAAPIAAALIIDLVVLIPISIAVIESANSSGKSFLDSLLAALKGATANPFFLAISAGVLLSASGLGLAAPFERFLTFLAGAAGPAALFSLGASLAGRSVAGDAAPIAVMSVLKLVVHPLLAWIALSLLEVEAFFMAVGVVLAAMPIAGNVFVIAENYGVMVRRLSAAILLTTIVAVVTVAVVLQWVGLAQ